MQIHPKFDGSCFVGCPPTNNLCDVGGNGGGGDDSSDDDNEDIYIDDIDLEDDEEGVSSLPFGSAREVPGRPPYVSPFGVDDDMDETFDPANAIPLQRESVFLYKDRLKNTVGRTSGRGGFWRVHSLNEHTYHFDPNCRGPKQMPSKMLGEYMSDKLLMDGQIMILKLVQAQITKEHCLTIYYGLALSIRNHIISVIHGDHQLILVKFKHALDMEGQGTTERLALWLFPNSLRI
ncbi:hypothetical protein OROMI_017746 [Orobanche minor]